MPCFAAVFLGENKAAEIKCATSSEALACGLLIILYVQFPSGVTLCKLAVDTHQAHASHEKTTVIALSGF